MGTDNRLLDWARYFADLGWYIFPITPGAKKPPMVRDWEHRATKDIGRIERCWSAGPWNIGLACGPSRLVGVDLDIPDVSGEQASDPSGLDTFAALATNRGASIPDTYTVDTPSGGRHLIYSAPEGVHLRNTRGELAPHVDTRAEGGYLVAAGSTVPGGSYDLVDERAPVELPAWVVQAALDRPVTATPAPIRGNPTNYGRAALRGECERVRQAQREQHNVVLSTAAYRIGRLVGGKMLDHGTARAELAAAGQALLTSGCECTPREIDRVIDAGLSAGIRNRRTAGRVLDGRTQDQFPGSEGSAA